MALPGHIVELLHQQQPHLDELIRWRDKNIII